jgi:ABC-2 type transport system permease protein
MSICGGVIKTIVTYYLWKAIFKSSSQSTLNGFTLDDMVMYIIVSFITSRLITNSIDFQIGEEVKQGSIAMNLIKPIDYHAKLFFEALGKLLQELLFFVLPMGTFIILIKYATIGHQPLSLLSLLLYFVSMFLSFCILFLINVSFGLIAFYTTNIWGVTYIKFAITRFLSGELIPIVFFPFWVQNILKFMPFTSLNYSPVMICLGKMGLKQNINLLLLQIVWIALLFISSRWVWHKAIRRLTILGG